ncbi:UDP-Glycosyltransferase superfamily protein [Euphorbia peplus]|nr:UDP-Glycosyltransferase superfamily protein [Euphorbia peplus]
MGTYCTPAATITTLAAAATSHIVAMPYPGRGHINPMMNLCKLISLKKPDILITFVVTEEWYNLISNYKIPPNIILRTIPNVIPSERVRGDDFPNFLEAVGKKMESPFEVLLDRIIHDGFPVDVIIADTYLDWIVRVGNRRNIPVASLWTKSATCFSVFYYFDLLRLNGHFPVKISERGDELVDYIPGIPPTRLADFPSIFEGIGRKTLPRKLECVSMVSKAQYLLFTCAYEPEAQIFDSLKMNLPFRIFTVGPLIPYFEPGISTDVPNYIEWLNSQPKNSVLYVSIMGSFLSVSNAQKEEIIAGISDSGVRCLWVSRGEKVGFGFDDRTLAVAWCDQLKVLNHPSVGGFWTHCGWNSTLEAAFAGVPILTSPIFSDQVPNSKKVEEDWKTGWRVKSSVEGESLVKRGEIKKIVENFMDSEKIEVIEMRKNAKEIKDVSQIATKKGGSSDTNIEKFISFISQAKNQ